ncbi:hypothetical protein EJ05DRAFT_292519 [Pseudovirgaria hyperparasitica]|uniref:N-acetyltransferase domain-containing protein n=1 Tax=Pseudovirgaria hyperparasitica TaxID=470096 RepID=A0A6A6WFI5_9PEZI|nr:uncharacterized protein EJ05DRAFT_292519 [Pseudovirgaria hyperparasitica]KAF2760656.1 hypothetical protein EJ05DRAFT_292519 [Pseudovirgaria hyperparasitica]
MDNMSTPSMLETAAAKGSQVWGKASTCSRFLWLVGMSDSTAICQPSVNPTAPLLPALPQDVSAGKINQTKAQIRKANLHDLDRIALVATAGFSNSAVFKYERPYYGPATIMDTISSYKCWFYQQITDGDHIVLVIETGAVDREHKHENLAGDRAIETYYNQHPGHIPRIRETVIAGIASVKVPRCHNAHNKSSEYFTSTIPPIRFKRPTKSLRRDESQESIQIYNEVTKIKKSKIEGMMKLESLVVHPTYWKNRYATMLAKWCCDFADACDEELGVSAAPMSQNILENRFQFVSESVSLNRLTLEEDKATSRDRKTVEPFDLHIGIRARRNDR